MPNETFFATFSGSYQRGLDEATSESGEVDFGPSRPTYDYRGYAPNGLPGTPWSGCRRMVRDETSAIVQTGTSTDGLPRSRDEVMVELLCASGISKAAAIATVTDKAWLAQSHEAIAAACSDTADKP